MVESPSRRLIQAASLSLVLLWITLPAVAWQTEAEPQAPPAYPIEARDLHRDRVVQYVAPGFVAAEARVKCGLEGDIYAVYSGNPSAELRDSPIRRVSVSSQRVTEYPFTAIAGYEKLARISFDVDAEGTLYELLRGHPQSKSRSDSNPKYVYLIVKFKEDGTMDTYFSLGEVRGQQVEPLSFAMFADGNSLVFGNRNEQGAHDNASQIFAATSMPPADFALPSPSSRRPRQTYPKALQKQRARSRGSSQVGS